VTFKQNIVLKKETFFAQIIHELILAFKSIFYIFFQIFRCSLNFTIFNLKLCSKQHNKIDLLHWIVVPQLSGGRQHNNLTKARQVGCANEHSMYS
jgi:hypothetical protein